MRAVVFTGAGGNEVVRLEDRPDPAPGSLEVLVGVRYAGLNPADLQQRAGRYPAPPGSPQDVPGLEVAGTVLAVGDQVQRFRPGDRVFGLVGGGGLADRVVAPEPVLAQVPENVDERDAAAVPEAFLTAHDAIRSQCDLRTGEVLLVHGANGGVGSAAVQIGAALGARVFGVVRSDDAAALVESLGGHAIPDDSFAPMLLEQTADAGADVIIELVGGVHFPANLDALAYKGRIVIVGTGVGAGAELPFRPLMAKRASLRGTNLRARPLEDKALAVRALEKEVLPHLAAGRVRALVDSVFPADAITDAFDRLAGPGKAGKVLIEF